MIRRDVVEDVAEVDFTDDCQVSIWMRRRKSTLTVTEAKAFRAELDKAIGEAERGLADLLAPTVPAAFDLIEQPRILACAEGGKTGYCQLDQGHEGPHTIRNGDGEEIWYDQATVDAMIREKRAAAGYVRRHRRPSVEPLGPDCVAGKHPCDGGAWDDAADVEVPCVCPCHTEEVSA